MRTPAQTGLPTLIHFNICGLFNDAVNKSDKVAATGRFTGK
jgi:hypothetical protein